MKRIEGYSLYRVVRLQLWFQDSKERYWVVDESQQDEQEHQAHETTTQDAGKGGEFNNDNRSPQQPREQ